MAKVESGTGRSFLGGVGLVAWVLVAAACSLANAFDPVERDEEPPCEADPCRALKPQCGCEAGQMCVLTSGDSACVEPVGTIGLGERCEGLACEPGSSCLGFDGSSRICMELCDAETACSEAGAECLVPLVTDEVSACSIPCDLRGTAGCASGMKCVGFVNEGSWFRVCVDAGTLGQDAPCEAQGDCGIGFFCIPPSAAAEPACLAWCLTDAGDCPLGYACAGFETPFVVDGVEMGVCLSS